MRSAHGEIAGQAQTPRRLQRARRAEDRAGLLFAAPWIFKIAVLTVLPLILTLVISFTRYSVVEPPDWVGTTNYERMIADPDFWKSAYNTAIFAVLSVPIKLLIALGLAILLEKAGRLAGLYRTMFYLPFLVPPIAATMVFILLLTPGAGPVNVILKAVGLAPPDWLKDPDFALWTLVILSMWPLGVETLVFLGGLLGIPSDIKEAATLDSRKRWHTFVWITLPLLTPMVLFNLVIGIIGSFQIFTQALVIGGTTGKPAESTLTFMVVIYRAAFRYFDMGYSAALSTVLFVVILLTTVLIFRTAKSWVFYEGGDR